VQRGPGAGGARGEQEEDEEEERGQRHVRPPRPQRSGQASCEAGWRALGRETSELGSEKSGGEELAEQE
jgi:hypothetical protein